MVDKKVFITNSIVHDFITRRRIFFHRHGQDIFRITRNITIFDTGFMASFTLANFALIALAIFDALIAFAFRNNMRRFVIVRQGDCHRGGYREFTISHLDFKFKLVIKNAGIFKVQSFFISDSNLTRRFIHNSKRDIVIWIVIFVHGNRIDKRIESRLSIIVSSFHFANKSSHRRIFLNIERSSLSKVRSFVHVGYGDLFVN